jgi:hypothetical protein
MNDINAQFLMNVFAICQSLGLAASQYDFSRLCGRSLGWFSAAKCLRLPLSIDVAMRLLLRLQKHAAKPDLPKAHKEDAEYLCQILRNIVQARLTT